MPETSLLQRLKERKLVQWALAYLAGAFVVFQAVEVMGEPWGISLALQRAVHIVLVFGLFITLVLAWYHGEKGQQRVSGPELLMVVALLVMAGVALSVFGPRVGAPMSSTPLGSEVAHGGKPGIAVLLCANLSTNPEDEYLADALHDEILLKLQKISSLFSIRRASVMQYAEAPPPMNEIASELGVGFVGECSVQKQGNRVRLIFWLLDGRTGEQIWAEDYDRGFTTEDLFDIQIDIAQQVADAVGAALTPEDEVRIGRVPTESLTAYDFYLLGKKWEVEAYPGGWEALQRAIGFYESAVQADSGFALAYAGLSGAYIDSQYWGPGGRAELDEAYRLAKIAAEKAVALDSLSAETRAALAAVLLYVDHDWERAEQEIRRAIDLDPGYYDAVGLLDDLLCLTGRYDEAVEVSQRAAEVDPSNPAARSNVATALWGAGRLEEAADVFGSVTASGTHLEMVSRQTSDAPEGWIAADPAWFHEMWVYHDMGSSYEEAFGALLGNLRQGGASLGELRAYQRRWGGWDWRSLWEAALDSSPPQARAQERAKALTRLGRFDEAVAELRSAWEGGEPGLYWVHTTPLFRDLEGFGPYEQLMVELGLRPRG